MNINELNAAIYLNLTHKEALETLKVFDYTEEDIKQLKVKPIQELKLVEAIACRRKTEYIKYSNEQLKEYYNKSPEEQQTVVEEISKDIQAKLDNFFDLVISPKDNSVVNEDSLEFQQQSEEYLNGMNLELNDISVEFSTYISKYSLEDEEPEYFDRFFAKYFVDGSLESEIGNANFYVIDATKFHVSTIREMADGIDFSLYETVSSVRIFEDEDHAIFEKEFGYVDFYSSETTDFILEMKDKMKTIMQHGLSAYREGYEQYTFEDRSYHAITEDIWGRILVLDDIQFYTLFNKPFLTQPLVEQLLASLKYVGFYDWIIINPNIEDDYLVAKNYPAATREEYIALLEKLGFTKSYGKLRNNRICYCMNLKN